MLGDTSCVAAYPLGTGTGNLANTHFAYGSNVTFNQPGHLTRNTNGTIESTVDVNQDAGFSIVTYTGASGTVGHGLSSTPQIIIQKQTNGTLPWYTYVPPGIIDSTSNYYYLELNTTAAKGTTGATPPTSTTFNPVSTSGNFVAYCFHSVSGYSKIGTYSGSGAAGNAITGLGFRPNWLMVKRTDASANSWLIVDNRRVESSGNLSELFANTTSAETTGYDIDFTADGFTLNTTTTNANASGTNNYLYMAFK